MSTTAWHVTAQETADRAEDLKQADGASSGRLTVVSDPAQGASIWAGVWTCEPSTWSSPFDADETFHVTAGHLRIEADGVAHELTPGVTAFFPKGLHVTWTIVEPVTAFVVIA
jgi:uncharacterized cupin superfamily protein